MTKAKTLVVSMMLGFSAIMLSSCIRPPSESTALVQVGRPALKFKLPDLSGQEVSLDQYRGKVVLLDFWATWCGPCRKTMPMLELIQKEHPSDLILLAINLQEPRDLVRDYARAQNVHSRILLDEQGSVGEVYGTAAIPMQVLIDKQGIVRYISEMGFDADQLREEISKLR